MLTGITILALCQLLIFKSKGCLLKGLFFTALGGATALILLSMAEPYLGFSLPLTKGTLLFSTILGVPGTLFLTLGKIFQQLL